MHNHSSQYGFGNTVYLKTEKDKMKGTVTSIQFFPGGSMQYLVNWKYNEACWHFGVELTLDYLPDYT